MKIKILLLATIIVLLFQNQIFCNSEKDVLIESLFEKASDGDIGSCEALAKYYYYQEKYYKKAMYWTFKGVEMGSSECMYILRHAYGRGLGVIDDVEEGLKWLLLASSLGHKEACQELKKIAEVPLFIAVAVPEKDIDKVSEKWEKNLEEARERAREWRKSHQNLFIGLD